uniref:RING-type E3 ubiquitin transferase n=1 Tax=Alexandrium andersonii TaxID=327968 RepID=A0A7S2J564_9DINO
MLQLAQGRNSSPEPRRTSWSNQVLMDICRFYAKGNCAFGTACRYEHVRPGESARNRTGGVDQPLSRQEEQQLELEEERVDPYDEQPCTFRQLREKYFGLYSEVDMRKYWQSEMKPTGNARPTLRAVTAADNRGNRNVCKFFLQGSCNFGDSCRNLHVVDVAQLDGDPAHSSQPTPGCGSSAALHAFEDEGQDALDLGVGPPPFPPPPPSASGSSHSPQDRWSRRARAGEDAECGICFESIRTKGERFGMLENCACAFCLSCIRSWRKQKEQQDKVNLRMCPLCRNESFFVVPCESLIMDPAEKTRAIEKYKHQMSLVPCQAFDYGRGKCPFGSSCFYAHLNPDGTRYNPAPVRKMVGMSGTQVIGEVKLSDFF